MESPIGGRRRVYNAQERLCIDPYKAEYMNTTTPTQRKILAQEQIFPVLFTYWEKRGDDLNTTEEAKRTNVSFI